MTQTLRRKLRVMWAIGALTLIPAAAFADAPHLDKKAAATAPSTTSDLDPAPVAALARQVDDAESQLDALSLRARSSGLGDAQLRSSLAAIPPIQARLADALSNLDPRLKDADARLAQLGPSPAAGAPSEDPETTQSRREILRYRQSVDVEAKQARLLATEADQLTGYLTERRRRLFSERLWVNSRSVLDPQLWVDFARAIPADLDKAVRLLDGEGALIARRAGSVGVAVVWALAALLAAVLVVPARILLNRAGEARLARVSENARSAAALLAVWWVLIAGLAPLIAIIPIQVAMANGAALTSPFAQIVSLFGKSVILGFILEGIASALLAPKRPAWRAAPVPDATARRLAPYPGLIAAGAALARFVAGVNGVLGATTATYEATSYLTLVFELAVIVAALSQIGRARVEHADASQTPEGANLQLPWILAAIAAWLALACAVAAILAGYLAFATLVVRELAWAAAVVGATFILMRGIDTAVALLLSPVRPLGRAIRNLYRPIGPWS